MTVPKTKMWRFCGGCYCYVVRRPGELMDEIYFSSPDRKKTTDTVLKLLKLNARDYFDIWINNEDIFKIRISSNGKVGLEIKHPEFPNPDEWYKVGNWLFDENTEVKFEEIVRFLTKIPTNSGGEFEGNFTPIFSDILPKTVSFTHPNLSEYADILGEAERRFNVEFQKKTTKWIPGNRYDTLEASYYYVQNVYSRIISRGKGGGSEKYVFDPKQIGSVLSSPVFLYLIKKPEGEGMNIWDNVVFSSSDIGKDFNYLDFSLKKISAADCGPWTDGKDILSDVKEWRLGLMERTLKNCCTVTREVAGIEKVFYKDLNLFFEPLYLYLGANDEEDMKNIGEYVNPIIEPVWRDIIKEVIAKNYIDKYKDPHFSPTPDDINKIFELILVTYIKEIFFDKAKLYSEMFDSLGFDYKEIIKEELQLFNWNDLLGTWENYLINYKLIPERDYSINFNPTYNSGYGWYERREDKAKIDQLPDVITNPVVRELILDTIKWSLDNHRIGLLQFDLQPGNKKSDTPTYEISLDVPCILKRLEVEGKELSEDMKNQIMLSKFWSIFMIVPVDIDWDKQY